MSTKLNITTVPFRSSRLAIPPSPFSPLLFSTPYAAPRSYTTAPSNVSLPRLPPPANGPLRWIWNCHECGRSYPLGATRRCLDDGHYFCAGTSTIHKRNGTKRVRRHRACGSEFDYQGWKDWGNWRRLMLVNEHKSCSPNDSVFEDDSDEEMVDVDEITESVVSPITPGHPKASSWRRPQPLLIKKDCWHNCNYPSECRWGRQYGLHTPTPTNLVFSRQEETKDTKPAIAVPATSFQDILDSEQQSLAKTIDGVEESPTSVPALSDLANLVSRAQRRHSRSDPAPSPLVNAVATPVALDSISGAGKDKGLKSMSSREALRRAVEGLGPEVRKGIGALADMVGGWRSASAPPAARVVEAAETMTENGGLARRKSLG